MSSILADRRKFHIRTHWHDPRLGWNRHIDARNTLHSCWSRQSSRRMLESVSGNTMRTVIPHSPCAVRNHRRPTQEGQPSDRRFSTEFTCRSVHFRSWFQLQIRLGIDKLPLHHQRISPRPDQRKADQHGSKEGDQGLGKKSCASSGGSVPCCTSQTVQLPMVFTDLSEFARASPKKAEPPLSSGDCSNLILDLP